MGVKLIGISELSLALKKHADMDAVKRIVKQNGAELNSKSQRNAPVDTGTLKRSIGLSIKDKGLTAEVEASAEYAGYVEWGTRFQEPQLYVSDAFRQQKEQFKKDMKKLTK